jgi:3-oxoacyl-[acyl-carrier protein] reductase
MNDGVLQGKVAVVTGSGRGLGRAMAVGLAAAGAGVAIVDVDGEVLEETAALARSAGAAVDPLVMAADVADEEAALDVVLRTQTVLGGMHILVNNAGLGPNAAHADYRVVPGKFWEVDVAGWRRVLDVNVTGAFLMARAVTPYLVGQGWGRIVNVTTSFDTMIRGGFAPYGPSKAANEAFAAIMAQELEGTGVTANVLVPGGPADTRMIPPEGPFSDRARLVSPAAMVPPLVWLGSDDSDGVTGRRFVASKWDPELPPEKAVALASAPAAWPQLEP